MVLTGSQLIEDGVQPKPGQTVRVTGAVGNVGRTAVYVARKHGMKVIAGVKTGQRKEAETLGAEQVVALDDDKASRRWLRWMPLPIRWVTMSSKADAADPTEWRLATVLGAPQVQGKGFRVQQVWAHPDSKRLHELAEAVARGEFSIPIAKRMKLSQVREAQTIAEAGGVSKILLIP